MTQKVNKKLTTKQRREQIIQLFQKHGAWKYTTRNLAQQFGVTHVQIFKDLKAIKEHTIIEDIHHTKIRMDDAYHKSQQIAYNIMTDPITSTTQRLQAIKTLADINKSYTEFKEAYGDKEKIADKQEIKHEANINLKQIKDFIKAGNT
jgi:DeoR/GlpR family transcriptional regulator of sugar metabolism